MKRHRLIAAYVLEIQNDIEPRLLGPYKSTKNRDRAAQRLRRKDKALESGIFTLDLMNHGRLRVQAYSASFVDDGGKPFDESSEEGELEEIRFRNHYKCPDDGTQWTDEWSCACNDRCPTCNHEIEPYESEEIDAPSEPLKSINRPGPRKDARNILRTFGA